MKTKRQNSRIAAFQILYEIDLLVDPNRAELKNDLSKLRKFIQDHFDHFQTPNNAREFSINLVTLALTHSEEIDLCIQKTAKNWQISRMSPIDRNILRLATAEMLHFKETPHVIIMNEAIEIAKEFGSDESSKFVNGVLDGLIQSKL